MRSDHIRAVKALRGGRAWLDDHKPQMDAITSLEPLIVRYDDIVTKLTVTIGEQERYRSAGLDRTKVADRLRQELWTFHLVPIVEIAKRVAPSDPELVAEVRLPRSPRNAERLLASAAAIATAVWDKQKLFTQNGLAPDFFDKLVEATAAYQKGIDDRSKVVARRTGTAVAIEKQVTEARTVLRLIDNVLKVALRGSEALTEWNSAKRIRTFAPSSAVPATMVAPVPAQPA